MDLMKRVAQRAKLWFDTYGYGCCAEADGYEDGVFLADQSRVRFEFAGIQYGPVVPGVVRPVTLERSVLVNNGRAPSPQSFAVNRKTASSFTFRLREGSGIRASAKVGLPLISGEAPEAEINLDFIQDQTTVVDQFWIHSSEIPVAPRTRLIASYVVNEASCTMPFTIRLRAHGSIRMAFPGRYPRSLHETTYWDAEIDDMLVPFGADLFTFDLPGTLEATHGVSYEVRLAEADAAARVIDAGRLVNGAPRSNLREIAAVPRQVENAPI